MRCEDIIELMSQSIDGCLEAEQEKLLETHLKGCPGCAGEFEALKQSVALLRAEEPVKAPGDLVARVREELEAKPISFTGWSLFQHPQMAVALAAGLVVMVGVYAVVRFPEEAGLKSEMDVSRSLLDEANFRADPFEAEDKDKVKNRDKGKGGKLGVGAKAPIRKTVLSEDIDGQERTPAAPATVAPTMPAPDAAENFAIGNAIAVPAKPRVSRSLKTGRLQEAVPEDEAAGGDRFRASHAPVLDEAEEQYEKISASRRAGDTKENAALRKNKLSMDADLAGEMPVDRERRDAKSSQFAKEQTRQLQSTGSLRADSPARKAAGGKIWQEARPTEDPGPQLSIGGERNGVAARSRMPISAARAADDDDVLDAVVEVMDILDGADSSRSGRGKQVAGELMASTSLRSEPVKKAMQEMDALSFADAESSATPAIVSGAALKQDVARASAAKLVEAKGRVAREGGRKLEEEAQGVQTMELSGPMAARDRVMQVLSGVTPAGRRKDLNEITELQRARVERAAPVSGPVPVTRVEASKTVGLDIYVEVRVERLASLIEELKALGVAVTAEPGGIDHTLAAPPTVQLHIFLKAE